jgi:hypothetical protein
MLDKFLRYSVAGSSFLGLFLLLVIIESAPILFGIGATFWVIIMIFSLFLLANDEHYIQASRCYLVGCAYSLIVAAGHLLAGETWLLPYVFGGLIFVALLAVQHYLDEKAYPESSDIFIPVVIFDFLKSTTATTSTTIKSLVDRI